MRKAWLGLSGWCVAGVVLLAGAVDRNEVRTRRLVVEDAKGRPFCVIEDADGRPGMTFLNPADGKEKLAVVVGGQSAQVWLKGEANRISILISGGPGGGSVTVHDSHDRMIGKLP